MINASAVFMDKKEFGMKNLFRIFVIIAFAAVIGFTMISCGSSSEIPIQPKLTETLGLTEGTPPSAALGAVGIDEAAFESITEAVPGYQGYRDGSLWIIWTGGTEQRFETLTTKVELELGIKSLTPHEEDEYIERTGNYGEAEDGKSAAIIWVRQSVTWSGITYPSGTLIVILSVSDPGP